LKNTPVSNFVIIRPLGVELFHAEGGHIDGRTDRDDEANRDFAVFEKASKMVILTYTWKIRQIFAVRCFVFEKNTMHFYP